MIQLHPRALAAAALVATTLLAGCSNETPAALPAPAGAPSATPSETVAPTPVESPTPSSTVTRDLPEPEPIEQIFTEDGASGFASYYVRVLNYSRNSGDVELLQSISDPGCTMCVYDIERITGFLRHGYSHVDLETQFRGTRYLSWDPTLGEVEMEVIVDRPPHVVVDRDGQEIEQVEGLTEGVFYLWLKWIDERWIVWEAE